MLKCMQESSNVGDAVGTLISGHAGCIDVGLRGKISVGHKLNVRTLHGTGETIGPPTVYDVAPTSQL